MTHARTALSVLALLALVGVHAVAFHHLASRIALPTAASVGLALLAVAKHTGLLATLHKKFSRR
jgi:hypothetical protein